MPNTKRSLIYLSVIAVSVFAVPTGMTKASATVQERVIVSFDGTNGSLPRPLSMDAAGNFWGVTEKGGVACTEYGPPGCGTVFELTPASGGWEPKTVYRFLGGNDGAFPAGNLVFDAQGNIYGTTGSGGTPQCQCGTVYKLTPGLSGWHESVIYRFKDTIFHGDGSVPWAGLVIDSAGNLYGVTTGGGATGHGTVFELSLSSDGRWTETILYSFRGLPADGWIPYAPLILDAQGNLYGTTYAGGTGACAIGCGVLFELSHDAGGGWTEHVLYTFKGSTQDDGGLPYAGLVFDSAGNLYGTASSGSGTAKALCFDSGGCGVVFELSPVGDGSWTEKVIHSFSYLEGIHPDGGLLLDAAGSLYGVTTSAGPDTLQNFGIVFKLAPNSSGGWTETVLHKFRGNDGHQPGVVAAGTALVSDADGNLYGTTVFGGTAGFGTVFKLWP